MPPMINSRYMFSEARLDDDNNMYLTEPARFKYDSTLPGTSLHIVKSGETIWTIAKKYYVTIKNGEHLWWIIADFQPVPIHDLTIDLTEGTVLYIPSVRVVSENVLGR